MKQQWKIFNNNSFRRWKGDVKKIKKHYTQSRGGSDNLCVYRKVCCGEVWHKACTDSVLEDAKYCKKGKVG